MTGQVALFPLATVLFPGLVLPLHVFEERYRTLVRDLLALPADAPREFGVVAIHRGSEVFDAAAGPNPRAVTLHGTGCSATVRSVTAHPDGRFDVVAVGRRRFEVVGLDAAAGPYLTAEVRWLDEPPGAAAAALVPAVRDALRAYLALLGDDAAAAEEQLPTDPRVLSYLVGATALLTVADRQALLTAPDTAARLRLGRRLLSRECGLLRRVRAVPQPLDTWAHRPLPN